MAFINSIYYKFRKYFSISYPKIFAYCNKRKAVVKFFIAGLFSGATDLIVLFILHQLLGIDIIFSTSFAFVAAFMISFSLQKLWTFRNYNHQRLPRQLVLYLFNAFVNMSLNAFFMHYLVNNLGIWYLLAQIMVNLFLGVFNFINYKFIIFKEDCHEN